MMERMSHWWHYLLLGVVALLLFLVMRFPAQVAYGLVADSLGKEVQLAGVTGTLWRGEAQQLQVQSRAVASLNWQLSAWGLLWGRLSGEVSAHQDDAYLQSQLTTPLGGGELSLSETEARIPLSLIQPYLTQLPLPLDGVISLKLDALQIDAEGRPQQATGRVVWHQAGVSAPQPLLFGDLQMDLENIDGGGIEGTISDSGGPLHLRATLTMSVDGAYQLEGKVKATELAAQELRQYLSLLGKADAEGFRSINLRGAI
ncbi:MAG: type II secretion system protein N [Pseudomonadota bacterium]